MNTAKLQSTPVRTCDDLGMCQTKSPACKGCTAARDFYFAPGAIEYQPRVQPAFTVLDFLVSTALVALGAFVAGWLL